MTGIPCAVPQCDNPIIVGTDSNCCPVACCPDAAGNTVCDGGGPPPYCSSDRECPTGLHCIFEPGCMGGAAGNCPGKCG
jgi:hypothetical protein